VRWNNKKYYKGKIILHGRAYKEMVKTETMTHINNKCYNFPNKMEVILDPNKDREILKKEEV